MPRKRRTRQHVIAELSVNHVERCALLCGFSVERIEHDYGIDLVLFTYDGNGEIENGQVFLRLKATDNLTVLSDEQTVSFSVERSDLERWLNEPMPCILVVYDALEDTAFWQYIQAYFEDMPDFNLAQAGRSVTIYLPKNQMVGQDAIRAFARYRDAVLSQLQGVIRHSADDDHS